MCESFRLMIHCMNYMDYFQMIKQFTVFPTKILWSILKVMLKKEQRSPTNIQELRVVLQHVIKAVQLHEKAMSHSRLLRVILSKLTKLNCLSVSHYLWLVHTHCPYNTCIQICLFYVQPLVMSLTWNFHILCQSMLHQRVCVQKCRSAFSTVSSVHVVHHKCILTFLHKNVLQTCLAERHIYFLCFITECSYFINYRKLIDGQIFCRCPFPGPAYMSLIRNDSVWNILQAYASHKS